MPTLQTVSIATGLIHMAKSARKSAPSTIANRTVPHRAPNSELRPREYLTEKEIERLQDTARKRSRYGHRDATMILVTYRHGLRASEVCGLRWDQVELDGGRLHVRRAKGGIDNVHSLSGREIRALRQLRRENPDSRYVFITERGGPATTAGFLKTIVRIGEAAKLPFPIHPHMLRHSTGYKLANDGHDTRALQHYMGHKNIMHTVRYTEMAPDRFKNFWKD
jgi:type 1 fimbriae regulatory protein FimB/type 1 fimbriae regulatory protein FimE